MQMIFIKSSKNCDDSLCSFQSHSESENESSNKIMKGGNYKKVIFHKFTTYSLEEN